MWGERVYRDYLLLKTNFTRNLKLLRELIEIIKI